MSIKQSGGKYYATSSAGRKLSKKGKSKKDAVKQLRAAEANKHKGK